MRWLLVILALLLTGCATVPPPVPEEGACPCLFGRQAPVVYYERCEG